ncbi:MAG: 50S ribosomal protein L1 [Microgenomates group bacterium GW2011_GWA1_48_10]|nr:MAG: 50S ribosomal protein L1 [Microgenomates group bacterium GW2011_GWA1_48_10]
MGDTETEEAARKKAEAKREQKKARTSKTVNQLTSESVTGKEAPTDLPGQKVKKKAKVDNKYTFPKGKNYIAAVSLVDKSKTYSLAEAISLVKKTSYSHFDGSVELHLNVSDKGLRGTVALPHGTGKQITIATASDELINRLIVSPKIDFDILVASPDMMPKLAKVAKILGPRGLMPNPKTNTISDNPSQLVKILQSSVSWKTQTDFPIIHAVIGKVSFDDNKLEENYQALIKSIGKDKVKSAFLKATMGPSIRLQV